MEEQAVLPAFKFLPRLLSTKNSDLKLQGEINPLLPKLIFARVFLTTIEIKKKTEIKKGHLDISKSFLSFNSHSPFRAG